MASRLLLSQGAMLIELNSVPGLGREATSLTFLQITFRGVLVFVATLLDPDRAGRNRISEHDILEDLRLHGNVGEIRDAALAVLERNGQISVVLRRSDKAEE